MSHRRAFLAQLGAAASLLAFDADELRAAPSANDGPWDTSWLDRLAAAKYRVVFNGNQMNYGEVMSYAATFLDNFHEVHGTADSETVPVIVFRRLGTALALNDASWNRYEIGAAEKIMDPLTNAPARRNIYWSSGSGEELRGDRIKPLHARGMISLVCNVALGNVGRNFAEQFKLDVTEVQANLRANLVPGAILVPSGIYALIRAQNAGCAFMPGT